MRRDQGQRLRLLVVEFEIKVRALADRTPDVSKLLDKIERELERALEAQITRIL